MANKKAKVDKSALPLVNSDNKYYVRYRVVLDKTKDSDWSDVFSIDGKPVVSVTGLVNVVTVSGKQAINIFWDGINQSPQYDIFVKWDGGQYAYNGSSVSTSYNIIVPPDVTTSAGILVQVASAQRLISEDIKVFEGSALI